MSDRYQRVEVTSRAAWREWLAAHHADVPGAWAVTYKKRQADLHVPYDALVEEALCFGWIDSQGRRLDEDRTQLLMTPRKRGSGWSRSNQQRIARLDAAGLLAAPGRAVVEAARADGSWHALDAVEDLVEPQELRDALDGTPGARALGRLPPLGEAGDPRVDRERPARRDAREAGARDGRAGGTGSARQPVAAPRRSGPRELGGPDPRASWARSGGSPQRRPRADTYVLTPRDRRQAPARRSEANARRPT